MTSYNSKEIGNAKVTFYNNKSSCHCGQLLSWSSNVDSNQTIASPSTQTTKQALDYNNFIQFNKVLVIGLGQLGLPVAKYVKKRGFDTYGHDLNPKAREIAKRAAIETENVVNFSDFDVFIICVSTHRPNDMFSPQIDGLLTVVEKISREAKSGALVSIESTVPKGTSRRVFELLKHRLHVVHAPHRWYALEEKEHGVNQLRIIGGVCECCLEAGMRFYNGSDDDGTNLTANTNTADLSNVIIESGIKGSRNNNYNDNNEYSGNTIKINNDDKSLGISMHPVTQIEIAETTKIVENAHRYLQIAFAEELYLYCQANNMSFSELRDALNTKWNVNILEPREGIGGHCLPKDTKMFLQSSNKRRSKILTAAIEADQDYKEFRAKLEKSNLLLLDLTSKPTTLNQNE